MPPIESDKTPRPANNEGSKQAPSTQNPISFLNTESLEQKQRVPYQPVQPPYWNQFGELKKPMPIVEKPNYRLPLQQSQLPVDEELSLIEDIGREMGSFNVDRLKQLYTLMLEQDAGGTSFIHCTAAMAAAKQVKVRTRLNFKYLTGMKISNPFESFP